MARDLKGISPPPDFYYFGHVADGNLHLMVGSAVADTTTHERVEAVVYDPLRALGGSVSAEHGIGLERRAVLGHSRSPGEIALMRRAESPDRPQGPDEPRQNLRVA